MVAIYFYLNRAPLEIRDDYLGQSAFASAGECGVYHLRLRQLSQSANDQIKALGGSEKSSRKSVFRLRGCVWRKISRRCNVRDDQDFVIGQFLNAVPQISANCN